MSGWLKDSGLEKGNRGTPPDNPQADLRLRCMDVVLASVSIVFLMVPIALGFVIGRLRGEGCIGRQGQVFSRLRFDLPANRIGQLLTHLRWGKLPVLFNIFVGDMAFVGPRPCRVTDIAANGQQHGLLTVRPGVFNAMDIRMRTAVHDQDDAAVLQDYLVRRSVRHDLGVLARLLLLAFLPTKKNLVDEARIGVGDVHFDNLTMDEALARVSSMLDGQTARQISFVNAACVNIAARHRGYRRILARVDLVLPDGIGIKMASNMTGKRLKQNVNGTDFFPRLCAMMEARGASLYLIGGQAGVAERVAAVVAKHWPRLRIAGTRDGFFNLSEEGQVAAQVHASRADVLLVARGVPMQDAFIDRHLHHLGVKAAFGVGGLFDFVSGRIDRAPVWMRESGLEWLYRLLQEPARMWRRYLLGNFTFLGRIWLQHHGFRKAADDLLKVDPLGAAGQSSSEHGLRTLLFVTACAQDDVPVPANYPAALLPLGTSTFIEQNLDALVRAGVREVELVVSAMPEEIRKLVGSGERWGLKVRWHLAKDMTTPYGMLRSLNMAAEERVLLGHADRLVPEDALRALFEKDEALVGLSDDQESRWLGWAGCTSQVLKAVEPQMTLDDLGARMCESWLPTNTLDAEHCLSASSARDLMHAQRQRLSEAAMNLVPRNWLRAPWGAYSPEAAIHRGAKITGPCLIGPGCFVADGAQVGANTVLSSDIIVSSDTVIQDCVVLPRSFLGRGLELASAIVNGTSAEHLRLGVRTQMPASDGLMLDLRSEPLQLGVLAGRCAAVAACVLVSPLVLPDMAVRRLMGRPSRWTSQSVVVAHDAETGHLECRDLLLPQPGRHVLSRLLNSGGILWDITAGRRCWFGVRPRTRAEWLALGQDWQQLLAGAPIGSMYAPAWVDDGEAGMESRAAADVFLGVQHGYRARLRLAAQAFAGAIKGQV